MTPVQSGRVTEIGFDRDSGTVYVRFTDGVLWQYRNVPEHVFAEFAEASSKGRFIRDVLDNFEHGPG